MAQQKSINVKVSTEKVLKALDKALVSRKKQVDDYQKAQENHKKQVADWEKSIIEYVKSGKAKATQVTQNNNWRTETKEASILITLPASLVCPESPDKPAEMWSLNSDIEELENAIALLKMTDEEFVSTSTYRGVARLIK
jgi:prefoldin subunit 5